MSHFQRLVSVSLVPIIALIALQILSPGSLHDVQNAVQRYTSNTVLGPLFPDTQLPSRAETPLIITSTTHWSHVEKMATIATELAQLGYPITFIVGRDFEDLISNLHPNIEYFPMPAGGDKMSDADTQTYLALPPGEEQELFIMKKVLVGAMPTQHQTLQHLFKRFRNKHGDSKPLVSLYDSSATGHYPVILGADGIRPDVGVAVSLAPLTLDSDDAFPFRWGEAPHAGPDARAVHARAYEEHYAGWFQRELNGVWEETLRGMGAVREGYPSVLDGLNSLADYLIALGIPEFEFKRGDLRANVCYFGSLKKMGRRGDEKKEKEKHTLPSWWDDISRAKKEGKKIIAVSQGTLEADPEDLVLPTLKALEDRDDVLVIASFVVREPEDVPGLVVPPNTRVAKFVPYDLLLPLVDLLVSNGGYGAVQHCLRLGIPMVVAGEGQDKITTNSLVEYTGVGRNLGVRQPAAEKLREAVNQVLEDGSFKAKAKDLSKQYDKYDMAKAFDGLIKHAVGIWAQKQTNS